MVRAGAADPVGRRQQGQSVDAARQLLGILGHAATLIDQAVRESAAGALQAGVALEALVLWARLPADVLAKALANDRSGCPGNTGGARAVAVVGRAGRRWIRRARCDQPARSRRQTSRSTVRGLRFLRLANVT